MTITAAGVGAASPYALTGSLTFSYVNGPASGAAMAVVGVEQNGSAADQISGITYGGVAMSRVRFDSETTEAGAVYIYWLDMIPLGTKNVVMTTTGSASKSLFVRTFTHETNTVMSLVGTGNTATSTSAANPSLTLTGLTNGVQYACWEIIHSGLNAMTATPQTTPAWALEWSNDLGTQGNGTAYYIGTASGTTIAAGWIASTADDYVISGVAFYETNPPTQGRWGLAL